MLRRVIASFIVALSVMVPDAALARSVVEIVDRKMETVSRSTFIQWSVEALRISRETSDCTLPYTRVPKGQKALICTAYLRGALDIFGSATTSPLSAPISRGEALSVISNLLGKADTSVDVSAFKDLSLEMEKQAVRNALAFKWMHPLRSTQFGFKKLLSGADALILLQAVTDELPKVERQTLTITVPSGSNFGALPKQQLLDAVWAIIQRDYIDTKKIDPNEVAYQAAEAIVKAIGDPYTNFFRPAEADNFSQQIKGELSGIGAQVEEKNGSIFVVTPIPGSPAERAGVMAGDELLEADGHVLKGLGVDRAVTYIRGQRGTTVQIKLRRSGSEILLGIVRDSISIPEISVSWQGDIAVVRLVQFGETTAKRIRGIFEDIAKKSPKGIVLDLRNNGGGLLNAADEVVSNFLPKGSVVAKVQTANAVRVETTEYEPTISASTKIVVLVNKGSASASEITAGALQDHKRATIVGSVTFGKGTVQEVISFPTGEALKVTVAEWLTPLDRRLNGIGVKPDVLVNGQNSDDELRRALDVLR